MCHLDNFIDCSSFMSLFGVREAFPGWVWGGYYGSTSKLPFQNFWPISSVLWGVLWGISWWDGKSWWIKWISSALKSHLITCHNTPLTREMEGSNWNWGQSWPHNNFLSTREDDFVAVSPRMPSTMAPKKQSRDILCSLFSSEIENIEQNDLGAMVTPFLLVYTH